MQLEEISHPKVYALGYDPAKRLMRVQYRNARDLRMPGRICDHSPVSQEAFEQLRTALVGNRAAPRA